MEHQALPTLSALDDVHSFWSKKWTAPKLGWHLNDVNPLLEKYTDLWLGSDVENNSVFVPLCGKSVDLAHLASHSKVSHVVGIDIVRDAAEQFASEHPELSMLEYTNEVTTCKEDETDQRICKAASDTKECTLINGSLFRGKGITFLLGDLFDFMTMSHEERSICISREKSDSDTTKESSQFDAIYDRASMIAIEPTKRQDYTTLLGSMLRPGGSILLITIEKRTVVKEDAKLSGPPFSIDEMQVRQFYEGQDWVESISLLEEKNEINSDTDRERWMERGVSEAYELVFLIRKKNLSFVILPFHDMEGKLRNDLTEGMKRRGREEESRAETHFLARITNIFPFLLLMSLIVFTWLILRACSAASFMQIYPSGEGSSPTRLDGAADKAMSTKNTNSNDVSSVIDLQLHTRRKPPSDFLASLSDDCKRLGIDTFDLYGDFTSGAATSHLRRFESEVANHFGKEDAVFCLSGGMAQCIALAINGRTQSDSQGGMKTKAFACHPTSHLLLHENNNFHELLGMQAIVLNTNYEESSYNPDHLKDYGCYGMPPIRLSHAQDMFAKIDGTESSGTTTSTIFPNSGTPFVSVDLSTFILELPHREIGGKLTPWAEVEEISRLCKARGVQFHCDGARIFEASAGYGHTSVEQTAQPFSSVYISFYKGLGNGIGGAMLLGSADFCAEARVWLRRFGGNLYSVLPYTIASWAGWQRNCLQSEDGASTEAFHQRQKKLARILELLQSDSTIPLTVMFDPAIPETNMVHGYMKVSYDECVAALKASEEQSGVRVLSRLRRCARTNDGCLSEFGCRFEWVMGESNFVIEDDIFVTGWNAFAKTCVRGNK